MDDARIRALGVTIAAVLATSVLSVGQLRYDADHGADTLSAAGAAGDGTGFDQVAPEAAAATAPAAAGKAAGPAAPGVAAVPGAATGAGPVGRAAVAPGAAPAAGPAGSKGGARTIAVPDFGLRTQGVAARSVTIGATYNKSGCGDGGAIEASLGAAVTGDPDKAANAFVRHVNDTGGIRGRTLRLVTADDGGPQCSERNVAAAIDLVDKAKVFLVIPGLHEVGDYVIKRRVPIFGGRSTKAEQRARGTGQFQMFQDADGDFGTWSSFGRYYLKTGPRNPACLVHPDTADFNNIEKVLVAKMRAQGLSFTDVIRYADDVSTGQQQATSAVIRMKGKGCTQVYFVANNILAMIFFTNAAQQQNWHPTYTFTARTAFSDQALGGNLMQQDQWSKAVGLSPRVPPGQHPAEGNCRRIYQKYYPNDGMQDGAYVTAFCLQILTTSEAMKRAVDATGVLTADSLMVGANRIQSDFYWEAHVPVTFAIPTTLARDFDVTGYDHQTVVKWNRSRRDYDFPEYPRYWRTMGAGGAGGEDLRPLFRKKYAGG